MRLILIAAALFATSAQAQAVKSFPTVPANFQGEWNAQLSACGTSRSDSVLKIGPSTLTFFESGGRIAGVFLRGTQLAIVANMDGEGENWLGAYRFTLSANGRTLSTPVGVGPDLVRYRCPPPRR